MCEKVQYIIVAAILVGAIVWIIVGIVRRKKKKVSSPCCGCSIADTCSRASDKDHREGYDECRGK